MEKTKIHFHYTDGEAGIIVQVNKDDLTDEKKIRLDEICERATAEINAMMNDREPLEKEYQVTLDSGKIAIFRFSAAVTACNSEKEVENVVSEFAKVTHNFYFWLARNLTGKSENGEEVRSHE